MSKVVVIGAGASGVIVSLKAQENNEVILVDGNDKCGKKILVTGNGKCNYWNENITINNYYTDDYVNLSKILFKENEVLNYLDSLGIYPKIKNGCYYPMSLTASSIREILEKNINKSNIKTMYNTKVIDIKKDNNIFLVVTDKETIKCDKVIIATGSKASPKTGSDGFGYEIAKKFNHKVNPILPSLVGLKSNNKCTKEWAGVRCDARLMIFVNNEPIKDEYGEIQLTSDGISGICTFNLSSIASRNLYSNNKVKVKINFVPNIAYFHEFLDKRCKSLPNFTISEILESIINYKLLNVILNASKIDKNSYYNELLDKDKKRLIKNICNFELEINDTNSFDKAQVCTGGILLKEINDDMSSIYDSNLYFTGEVLDVDGVCGGFNLAFAFITGFIAGDSIK